MVFIVTVVGSLMSVWCVAGHLQHAGQRHHGRQHRHAQGAHCEDLRQDGHQQRRRVDEGGVHAGLHERPVSLPDADGRRGGTQITST